MREHGCLLRREGAKHVLIVVAPLERAGVGSAQPRDKHGDASIQGDETQIAFNGRYLRAATSSQTAAIVHGEGSGGRTAVLLTGLCPPGR